MKDKESTNITLHFPHNIQKLLQNLEISLAIRSQIKQLALKIIISIFLSIRHNLFLLNSSCNKVQKFSPYNILKFNCVTLENLEDERLRDSKISLQNYHTISKSTPRFLHNRGVIAGPTIIVSHESSSSYYMIFNETRLARWAD